MGGQAGGRPPPLPPRPPPQILYFMCGFLPNAESYFFFIFVVSRPPLGDWEGRGTVLFFLLGYALISSCDSRARPFFALLQVWVRGCSARSCYGTPSHCHPLTPPLPLSNRSSRRSSSSPSGSSSPRRSPR